MEMGLCWSGGIGKAIARFLQCRGRHELEMGGVREDLAGGAVSPRDHDHSGAGIGYQRSVLQLLSMLRRGPTSGVVERAHRVSTSMLFTIGTVEQIYPP